MESTDWWLCLTIVVARMCDVTLGTLRTSAVVQGRRGMALSLGFVEVLIWVTAVSKVVQNLTNPLYAVAYAAGFALGNFTGVTLERHLAFGNQVVRVFTRRAAELAPQLRKDGYWVTEIDGRGMDGPISILFIALPRRQAPVLGRRVLELDADCYFVVDDVRLTRSGLEHIPTPGSWRGLMQRK